MSEPDASAGPTSTGDEAVDAAIAGLVDLDDQPLADHHDRLARAHELLHGELSREPSGPPVPGR